MVDGVVASPHVRWGYVWGRLWLPAAVNPYVPAVMEALLTPFWLAYKVGWLAGWRLRRLGRTGRRCASVHVLICSLPAEPTRTWEGSG